MGSFGGDHTAAAGIYSVSNQFSWLQALAVPGVQALANIALIERQKGLYDDISDDQKAMADLAVGNYAECINSLIPSFEGALPDVPLAAEYVPVNPCAEQGDTIECNIGHIARANNWAQCINRLHEQNDLTRMVVLDPRWLVNMDLHSLSIQDLLRGKLSVGDVVEVMTDTAETAAMQGRIGGTRHLTARNLGLSKLRSQAQGREEMRQEAGMLETVSPHKRQADIREMMQKPEQRLALALTQAQLIQNSLQNVYNRNAQKPPHRLEELKARMEFCINKLQAEMTKTSMTNTFVPNYAAILRPQVDAILNPNADLYSPSDTTDSSYNSPSVGGRNQRGLTPTGKNG